MRTRKKPRPGMTVKRHLGLSSFMMPPTVLDEAARLTVGDRQADYGHPIEDHTRTATMWSALLGRPVTAEQVCLCMVALKLSRQCHRPKRDNLVDACGYLRNVEMIEERRLVAAEDGFKWIFGVGEEMDGRRRCKAARAAAKSAAGGKRVR